LIGRTKDQIPDEQKSGIYEIDCISCCSKYRGQTARRCAERWAEHERAYRLHQPKKSAMAEHCIEEHHKLGDFKILKEVREGAELNSWESLYIAKGKNLVNIDEAPISSPLFKL
jgi:hypothetical protein